MRYLLVGNAPQADLSDAETYDVIVQVNGCTHAERLPLGRTKYVFVVNTDDRASIPAVDKILKNKLFIEGAKIILCRNIIFYKIKGFFLKSRHHPHAGFCERSLAWRRLLDIFRIGSVSFWSSFLLEIQLNILGKPLSFHPSSGLIAYNWLTRLANPGDFVGVTGFTFEGWGGHPWEIEKKLIKSHTINNESYNYKKLLSIFLNFASLSKKIIRETLRNHGK